MNVIEKGVVANIDGNQARINTSSGRVTPPIIIPRNLRSGAGSLQKGVEVVYVLFGDQTGIILGHMDGEVGEG